MKIGQTTQKPNNHKPTLNSQIAVKTLENPS